jgi:hypothetical protein
MQKLRVTQRNIQFQESVQIREIPRTDSEPFTEVNEIRRLSWDPNLNEVIDFFRYKSIN